MTTDWRSQYGLLEYLASKGIYPAPAIVEDGNDGTYSSIQEALDAGESDIFVRAAFAPVGTITLPDRNVRIAFAPGATVTPVGAFPIFTIPDVLTAIRRFVIESPTVNFTGLAGQEFLRIADTHGYAEVEVRNPGIDRPKTLVNFTAYDESYSWGHRVKFTGGYVFPDGNNSVLGATPNPYNTFAAYVTLSFESVVLGRENLTFGSQKWFFDFDGDMSFIGESLMMGIKEGSACGSFTMIGYGFVLGDGDLTVGGSHGYGGSTIISGGLNGSGPNSRVTFWDSGGGISGWSSRVAFRMRASPCSIKDMTLNDGDNNLANPGVEITATLGARAVRCTFTGAFAAGCIKTAKPKCVIEGNVFEQGMTGKTILLEAPSDNCAVHDNIGVTLGTGITLVGATTIAQAHHNF